MWLLAGALWLGFKVAALRREPGLAGRPGRVFGYFCWVGMDAGAFAGRPGGATGRGVPVELAGGLAAMALGGWLVWGLTPVLGDPVLRGWAGMAGVVLLLHFGLFALAGAGWRAVGVPVRPLMERPWRARTLAEFWGARWNRGFSDVARFLVFRPLARRLGPAAGTLAGFGMSGLAHELVVSVPAAAGFGLPTAYFLIQGLGVLAGRRLRRPSRVLVWALVILPAPMLFHPPFMRGVIGPFLDFLT
jgi:alginate O-acetyltransferase complex protein AlgI